MLYLGIISCDEAAGVGGYHYQFIFERGKKTESDQKIETEMGSGCRARRRRESFFFYVVFNNKYEFLQTREKNVYCCWVPELEGEHITLSTDLFGRRLYKGIWHVHTNIPIHNVYLHQQNTYCVHV